MADTGCGCTYCLKEREIWRGRESIKDKLRDKELEYDSEVTTEEMVDHPKHYNSHPSGIECIDVIEWMSHNVGAAIKYAWRAGLKTNDPIQDLEKARWYIGREIRRLKG